MFTVPKRHLAVDILEGKRGFPTPGPARSCPEAYLPIRRGDSRGDGSGTPKGIQGKGINHGPPFSGTYGPADLADEVIFGSRAYVGAGQGL